MPSQVLTDAYVTFDSQNLSSYVRSVTLTYEAEALDETLMGDTTRTHIGGLKSWSADVELYEDTNRAVDAIMFSRVGSVATLVIRADATGKSGTNPEYSGSALLESYPIFGAGVGEISSVTVTFQSAGALSRSTS
jgi:hypothetical protein